jgi:hypothetical protein
MKEADIILKAIDEYNDAHQLGIRGIQLNIEASNTVVAKELQKINAQFSELNGSVKKLKEDNIAGKKVIDEFRQHQKFGQWIHKNWWAAILIFMTFVSLGVLIIDTLGIREAISLLVDKL